VSRYKHRQYNVPGERIDPRPAHQYGASNRQWTRFTFKIIQKRKSAAPRPAGAGLSGDVDSKSEAAAGTGPTSRGSRATGIQFTLTSKICIASHLNFSIFPTTPCRGVARFITDKSVKRWTRIRFAGRHASRPCDL